MKKIKIAVQVMAIFFLLTGVSNAISFTDLYDPGVFPGIRMSSDSSEGISSLSWTFNILDDGYDPELQQITSAEIALVLRDDRESSADIEEYASLDIGDNLFNWEVDSGIANYSLSGLITLSETGMIDVALTALSGDFLFKYSTLTATVPVPEPATLMLLGAGLIGIAGIKRRRAKRNNG